MPLVGINSFLSSEFEVLKGWIDYMELDHKLLMIERPCRPVEAKLPAVEVPHYLKVCKRRLLLREIETGAVGYYPFRGDIKIAADSDILV